jgi:NhaA family Na+:H+ antiporter
MTQPDNPTPHVGFLRSDRLVARAVQPLVRFLHVEAAGGVLLLLATAVALVWANSPWADRYESLWATEIVVQIGSWRFEESLGHIVNDLLMAVFFFVVGMEIKREVVVGELRDRRAAALPALAALGGMVVPAAIFLAFNIGGEGVDGWGVPMATDIAFAVAIVTMIGRRVPPGVKVLLLALAIIDDIGAIVVIAVFYTEHISAGWLFVACALVIVVAVMHRWSVIYPPVLVAGGLGVWLAVYESGIHATIAGVVMGLLMPARPRLDDVGVERLIDRLENRPELEAGEVRATAAAVKASVSDCDRAIEVLHPWSSFVIVPLFALANAGIELSTSAFSSPSAVFLGVLVGLVVGKLVGVVAFSWLAVRLRVARLPDGVGWAHVMGLGAVAGVGFTVSLFIAGLAFSGDLLTDAKLGVLTASAVASVLGAVLLARAPRAGR